VLVLELVQEQVQGPASVLVGVVIAMMAPAQVLVAVTQPALVQTVGQATMTLAHRSEHLILLWTSPCACGAGCNGDHYSTLTSLALSVFACPQVPVPSELDREESAWVCGSLCRAGQHFTSMGVDPGNHEKEHPIVLPGGPAPVRWTLEMLRGMPDAYGVAVLGWCACGHLLI